MGLARLCAKVATHDELVDLLEELERDNIRLRSAIDWALGQNGSFGDRGEKGPFWWRNELRERAK